MLSRKSLKLIADLKQARERKAQGRFVVEGAKLVSELLLSSLTIEAVYVTEQFLSSGEFPLPDGVSIEIVPEHDMARLSNLSTPPGILAVAGMRASDADAHTIQLGWSLALDGINDPGNMGTLLRTAEWFGMDKVYCSEQCVDVYNPKVVQSSMGSVFRVQVIEDDLSMILSSAREKGISVAGAVLNGNPPDDLIRSLDKGILLIGSESHGIRPELLSLISHPVTIARYSSLKEFPESLNAAVAAGILMHFLRSD